MKQHINGIKIMDFKATQEQLLQLAITFNTSRIIEDKDLQIYCFIAMTSGMARLKAKTILNCSYSQIRVKYHEK